MTSAQARLSRRRHVDKLLTETVSGFVAFYHRHLAPRAPIPKRYDRKRSRIRKDAP